MSCCPSAPPIKIGSAFPDEPTVGPVGPRVPGESEDCYQKRIGNQNETGRVDDKTEPVPAKIKQNSVPVRADGSVNITFTCDTSDNWIFERFVDDVGVANFPGESGSAPTLSIAPNPANYEKRLKIRVVARQGTTTLDDRTFVFSPSVARSTDSFRLRHPLPGSRLTSRFGPRRSPTVGASSNHGGADFATGRRGSKVLAAADGRVTLCRPGRGYGNYIIIDHFNGSGRKLLSTVYAHLDQFLVALGDTVTAGQPIGIEGSTGIGTGPHLHFEVRLPNNTRVDPLPYLEGGTAAAASVTPNNEPVGSMTEPDQQGVATSADVNARTKC